jgi:hypothetical protein
MVRESERCYDQEYQDFTTHASENFQAFLEVRVKFGIKFGVNLSTVEMILESSEVDAMTGE